MSLSNKAIGRVVDEYLRTGDPPFVVAGRMGLLGKPSSKQVAGYVMQAIADNIQAVCDAIDHPKKRGAIKGFLVGRVMSLSRGRADGKLVARLVDEWFSDWLE